jgi:hypothetical protein
MHTILAPERGGHADSMRETHLCNVCWVIWRELRALIYGSLHANHLG